MNETLNWKRGEYRLTANSKAIEGAHYTISDQPRTWSCDISGWLPRTRIDLSFPSHMEDGKWMSETREFPYSVDGLWAAMKEAERMEQFATTLSIDALESALRNVRSSDNVITE